MYESPYTREKLWASADRASHDTAKWQQTTKPLAKYFYNEVIGRFDRPMLPADPRTRKLYDESKWTGYEVVLDVFPDVIAYGILLLPKDIKPGEAGRSSSVSTGWKAGRRIPIEADPGERFYHALPARLAERGFITYAPQNLYIFGDRFRTLQRKANPLGKTLFSIIVPQHQQIGRLAGDAAAVDPRADRLLRPVATAARRPCACRHPRPVLPVDLLGRFQRMDLEERLDSIARTATSHGRV